MPPGLSERTMGKVVTSTLPKETDRLLRVPVSAIVVELSELLVVRLHSVLAVLPESSSTFEAGRSVSESWCLK